jgi:hypothetical protein
LAARKLAEDCKRGLNTGELSDAALAARSTASETIAWHFVKLPWFSLGKKIAASGGELPEARVSLGKKIAASGGELPEAAG